jgi:hypothetical protein
MSITKGRVFAATAVIIAVVAAFVWWLTQEE